mmetsp:Transcript_30053/g.63952  ORF Transcript_30053/g.63952 Transcript_30053/m.63952 type:complete len:200 (+) Transcript_30053:538-1137(+)
MQDLRRRVLGAGDHHGCFRVRADGKHSASVRLLDMLLRSPPSRIPHDDALVLGAGADELAAHAPTAAGDALRVARKDLHQLASGCPPHPCHCVQGARNDRVTLRMPQDPLHLLGGAFQGVDQGAAGSVPDPQSSVVSARRHILAIMAEAHLRHSVCVPLEAAPLHTPIAAGLLLHSPEHCQVILAACDHGTPVCGAEGH